MDSTRLGTSQRRNDSQDQHLMTKPNLAERRSKPLLKISTQKTDASHQQNAYSLDTSAIGDRLMNQTSYGNRLNLEEHHTQGYPSITLTNWRKGGIEVTNKTRFQRIHKRAAILGSRTIKRMLMHSKSNESLIETQSKLKTLLRGIAPNTPTEPFRTLVGFDPILQNKPPFSLSCLDPSPIKQGYRSPNRSGEYGPPKLDRDRVNEPDFITANRHALQHSNPVKSQKLLQTYLSSSIFKLPSEAPLFNPPALPTPAAPVFVPKPEPPKNSRSPNGGRGNQSRKPNNKKVSDVPVSQLLSSFLTNLSRGLERKHAQSRVDKLDFLGTHFRERLDKVTEGLEGLVRAYRETTSAGEVMFGCR